MDGWLYFTGTPHSMHFSFGPQWKVIPIWPISNKWLQRSNIYIHSGYLWFIFQCRCRKHFWNWLQLRIYIIYINTHAGVALPFFVVWKVLVFTFWFWRFFDAMAVHEPDMTWHLTDLTCFWTFPVKTPWMLVWPATVERKTNQHIHLWANLWMESLNMSRTTKGRKVPTFRPYRQIDPIRRGTALTKIFPAHKKWWLIGTHKQNMAQVGIIYWGNLKQNLQWTSRKFPMRGFSHWMMNSIRQLIQQNDNSKPLTTCCW